MDDKIQSKWDEFKNKEDEYLKINQEIDQRRKLAQQKMQMQLQSADKSDDGDEFQKNRSGVDEFGLHDDDFNDEGDDQHEDNQDDRQQSNGEGGDDDDEQHDNHQGNKELSNREYIDRIVNRVTSAQDKSQKRQSNPTSGLTMNHNHQREGDDGDGDDDAEENEEDIDAQKLLHKQELLEEKLAKYKKIDAKRAEELVELEMMVEEQEKIIRVQRIRQDGLHGEVESLSDELNAKESILVQLSEQGRSFEEESESYATQVQLLTAKIEETKKQTAQFNQMKIAEEKQVKAITNEIDSQKKELKKKGVELNKKDIKVNRLQEEIDKLKMSGYGRAANTMVTAPANDKAAEAKKTNENLHAEIKKTDRQISELLQAFKKQLRLIDILKRQKNHLIAGQIFAYTEEQFLNSIEMGSRI